MIQIIMAPTLHLLDSLGRHEEVVMLCQTNEAKELENGQTYILIREQKPKED